MPIRAQGLGQLLALTPNQFEHAVATMLTDRHYSDVVVRGGSGDLGVDISCRDQAGSKVAVQCKRYAPGKSVGSPDMQLFVGMLHHHGASNGMYVTTSSFTKSAQDLARQYRITLIDGAQLSRWTRSSPVTPAPFA
jgi:restriction system protein